MKKNPYNIDTEYESELFQYRQVRVSDADELLICYSDERAVSLFNSDSCTSDFYYKTKTEMISCIKSWNAEFKSKSYIRHGIISKKENKVVGSIEFFIKGNTHFKYGNIGVLRIDISTEYEDQYIINDILSMVESNYVRDFDADTIITKAIPLAFERIDSLRRNEYKKLMDKDIVNYEHYFYKACIMSNNLNYNFG